MQFKKIHIYYRQTSHNKISPTRMEGFCYERAFKTLLDSLNPDLSSFTVCFDGCSSEFNSHFTKKYQNIYGFRVVLIDTKSFNGKSYENDGSSKSSCLVSKIIQGDNLSEDCLIMISENDYIFRPIDWCVIVLDLYNNYINNNYYLSLYDHLDKYIFNKDVNNHWGMYKDLRSKIILSSFCHFREVPNITSSWIMPKQIFDRDISEHSIGISDNTGCDIWARKYNTKFLSPIPSISCHSESCFIAPFIDWQSILKNVKLIN